MGGLFCVSETGGIMLGSLVDWQPERASREIAARIQTGAAFMKWSGKRGRNMAKVWGGEAIMSHPWGVVFEFNEYFLENEVCATAVGFRRAGIFGALVRWLCLCAGGAHASRVLGQVSRDASGQFPTFPNFRLFLCLWRDISPGLIYK